MAIDTENKRRSVHNFFLFTLPPVPDGVIGDADRVQVAGLYSGIPISASVDLLPVLTATPKTINFSATAKTINFSATPKTINFSATVKS